MSDPKLDAKLQAFLDADARARREGTTLEAVHAAVLRIAADRLEDRKAAAADRLAAAEDRRTVARLSEFVGRYMRRTQALERQMQTVSAQPEVPDWRPDPREITGTHELAEIRRAAVRAAQHDELVESRKWWREHFWQWTFAAIGALFLAGISGCAYVAYSHITISTVAAPK